MVELVKSFHVDMKARLSINGQLMEEEVEVENGLRQGCTLAPTLFNLYACLVMERWTAQVRDLEGVGTSMLCKLDGKLFRRSTRASQQVHLTECQFADDAALLATTRSGAEQAILIYINVAKAFGLTVSLPKTKLMVTGFGVEEEDVAPITVHSEVIECVDHFLYLGSVVSSDGRIDVEVDCRIAKASKAFGALRCAVFKDSNLTITTKRRVYEACVLSILLYGSECWTPLRRHLNRLNAFHHRNIRTALGITNRQQWELRISSAMTRELWGDTETIEVKITKQRLEWLGHIARMSDHCMPKKALFGWLPQTRPQGGPRKRWRDQIRMDLKAVDVPESEWYDEATLSRGGWRATYRDGLQTHQDSQPRRQDGEPTREVRCHTCARSFRRESDKKRHKCVTERSKPVQEQRGAVQCTICQRWFRSRGGLSVHRCLT